MPPPSSEAAPAGGAEDASAGPALDPAMEALIRSAETAYTRMDWRVALNRFRILQATRPALADGLVAGLAIGHCEIELGLAADLPIQPRDPAAPSPPAALAEARVIAVLVRAQTLALAGELGRVADLARLLAAYDDHFAAIYREQITAPAQPPALPGPALPTGLTGLPDAAAIARIKARGRDLRMLLLTRRFYVDNPARRHQHSDNLLRSAAAFGLIVRVIDNWNPPPGVEPDTWPAWLEGEIEAWDPAVIFFDDLFARGLSARAELGGPVAARLAAARRRGRRVISLYPDAWLVPATVPYRGLGESVDLVTHSHVTMLAGLGAVERAATLCFPMPYNLPDPAVAAGTIPRLGFVGNINYESPSRLVWWAEAARAGLPLDVHLTDHGAAEQRSDQAYADLLAGYQLSLNLVRRRSGARILTGRSIETLLCGGVLVEEEGPDTRHFLRPGIDYHAFDTLAGLDALVRALLADPERRRRTAAAGQAWARRWFTGDVFWAALLGRLFGGD